MGERRRKLHNLRTALANNAAWVPVAKPVTRNTGCLRQNCQLLYKLCNYKTNTLVTVTPPFNGNNEPVTLTTFWCFLSADVQVCLQLDTHWQRRPINIAVPNQRLHLLTLSHNTRPHRASVLTIIYKGCNKEKRTPLNMLSMLRTGRELCIRHR